MAAPGPLKVSCYNAALRRNPAVSYVLPFLVFIGMLALQQAVPVPVWLRFAVSMATILAVSLFPLRGSPSKPLLSILVGIAVFIIWIGPDLIAPGWRHIFLFNNPLIPAPAANTPPVFQHDPVFLSFRIAISVIAVPILEELFWRGWLMRWLIDSRDFERVPLGTFAPAAFWVTALLFASEHGPFWDVGLVAGVVYNWWMIRTRNLWDCILAHAVTNGILAAYVIGAGQWQYWL
ncbi:MAG TPA: CAAX prenyl protease-related protein [Bryobacteraceae bacterium]|nr:CAAX prenyl protease-related protein [Bryobacteraceae bacterium]